MKPLSVNQKNAVDSIGRNGRIIGWKFRWENPEIIEPIPHNLTIQSLRKRRMIFQKSFREASNRRGNLTD